MLIVTLLMLVAMMLVSMALLRSTDTSIQVINNLSFRQAAEAPAKMAVERVIRGFWELKENGTSLPFAFFSNLQGDSPEGIPLLLLGGGGNLFTVDDMTVRYVVERMCRDEVDAATQADPAAEALAGNCILGGGDPWSPHTDGELGGAVGTFPIFRVSIRVDGVRNTRVFAQAFIR